MIFTLFASGNLRPALRTPQCRDAAAAGLGGGGDRFVCFFFFFFYSKKNGGGSRADDEHRRLAADAVRRRRRRVAAFERYRHVPRAGGCARPRVAPRKMAGRAHAAPRVLGTKRSNHRGSWRAAWTERQTSVCTRGLYIPPLQREMDAAAVKGRPLCL